MRGNSPKTSLFLTELIIMILFFSVSAAVCMRLFASAHTMSKDSRDLSSAVMEAQSAAECFKSAGGDISGSASILGASVTDSGFVINYDSDWIKTDGGDFEYYLALEASGSYANICVYENNSEDPIFELTVKAVSYEN